ncbi:hypothetical protein ECZU45_38860 [Escherichia coli]|nr:hypothetical protein ECZU45_38860 [Escherichia coli]
MQPPRVPNVTPGLQGRWAKGECQLGISGDGKTAFIEMAAASGLELVPAENAIHS